MERLRSAGWVARHGLDVDLRAGDGSLFRLWLVALCRRTGVSAFPDGRGVADEAVVPVEVAPEDALRLVDAALEVEDEPAGVTAAAFCAARAAATPATDVSKQTKTRRNRRTATLPNALAVGAPPKRARTTDPFVLSAS